MKNNSQFNKGYIVPVLLAIIAVLIIGGGAYVYENNKSVAVPVITDAVTQKTISTEDNSISTASTSTVQNLPVSHANNNFSINVTSASVSDKILAYNSGFNNEYSELCFDNINQAPNPCSGISTPTDFDVTNPQMSFVIPSTVTFGSHTIQVCGLIGEGSGNQTSGCTNKVNLNIESGLIVSGMSQYTDSNFGFSFWYPSSWTVDQNSVTSSDDNGWFQGGTIVKQLNVHGAQAQTGVTIQEFHSSGFSITELGQTKSASPVGVDQKYFFDTNTNTWMYENITETPSGSRPAGTITAADVSNNTIGGLHIFSGAKRFGADSIITLSASDFLVVSTNDPAGYTDQKYLVDTVTATNPAVATPVPAARQKIIIQAEATAYANVSDSSQSSANPDMAAGRGGSLTQGNSIYTNNQYGFSMNYQQGVTTSVPYMWASNFTQSNLNLRTGNGVPVVSIPVLNGSNGYGSGKIDIGLSTNASDVSNCLVVPPNTENAFTNFGNITINGITFLHMSAYQPAAGQFRSTDGYLTLHNGVCWSIELNVDGTETNHLSTSQAALANADYAQVKNEMSTDLQTFHFTN